MYVRRIFWILGVALTAVALAACGGDAEEVEQLQADVATLEGEIDALRGELLEARGAVERQAETLDDLSAQIGSGEDSSARRGDEVEGLARRLDALSERVQANAAGAVEGERALTAIEDAVAELAQQIDALLRGPLVAYFQQVERLTQAYDASTEEGAEVFEAAVEDGDLEAARAALDALITASRVFSADLAAVAPPAQVAALHAEAVAALRALSVAVAQFAPGIAEATTLEAFLAAFTAFVGSSDADVIGERREEACEALQDFARELGIDVELNC